MKNFVRILLAVVAVAALWVLQDAGEAEAHTPTQAEVNAVLTVTTEGNTVRIEQTETAYLFCPGSILRARDIRRNRNAMVIAGSTTCRAEALTAGPVTFTPANFGAVGASEQLLWRTGAINVSDRGLFGDSDIVFES